MSNKDLREGRDVVFADGVKRTIYPLTIRQLRKFMKVVKELNTSDPTNISDKDIDMMIDATAIALEKVDAKLAEDKEAIEDIVDIKSFNQVLTAAMGADPNV